MKPVWYKLLILLGGMPLLAVMLIDTLAVVGRRARIPLNGSIELIQAALLISGVAAMLVATVAGTHAVVRLLMDRVPPTLGVRLERATELLSGLYFVALLGGSVWLAADMWAGHEQSELLGLPYRPLRILLNLGIAAVAVVFAYRALRRRPK